MHISVGYIVTPVGGSKWLFLQISSLSVNSFIQPILSKPLNQFRKETSDFTKMICSDSWAKEIPNLHVDADALLKTSTFKTSNTVCKILVIQY